LAAVLSGKVPEDKRQVGVMLSGGNIDSALFAELIATVSS